MPRAADFRSSDVSVTAIVYSCRAGARASSCFSHYCLLACTLAGRRALQWLWRRPAAGTLGSYPMFCLLPDVVSSSRQPWARKTFVAHLARQPYRYWLCRGSLRTAGRPEQALRAHACEVGRNPTHTGLQALFFYAVRPILGMHILYSKAARPILVLTNISRDAARPTLGVHNNRLNGIRPTLDDQAIFPRLGTGTP